MDRKEAIIILSELINSGILNDDIENKLDEIISHICNNDWEQCDTTNNYPNYCEGCPYEKDLS